MEGWGLGWQEGTYCQGIYVYGGVRVRAHVRACVCAWVCLCGRGRAVPHLKKLQTSSSSTSNNNITAQHSVRSCRHATAAQVQRVQGVGTGKVCGAARDGASDLHINNIMEHDCSIRPKRTDKTGLGRME